MPERPHAVVEGFPLARLTSVGTGGPARYFARVGTLEELAACLGWAAASAVAVRTVGLGSNLLPADAGFDGLVLRLERALATTAVEGVTVACGGGASLAVVVRRAADAGLTGIEFGCAIPGTVGGAVRMNAGAYGRELCDVLADATVVSAGGSRIVDRAGLALAYRTSNVAEHEVVASARLVLVRSDTATVREAIRALQEQRAAAQPRKVRTFGSVFKNPPGDRTSGQLLEACGLKGHAVGGARFSPVHANFIENTGGATSADVVALIGEGRRRVEEQFGIALEHEVELLGPVIVPA
jgi:UDP-N-acetylmuramate dehydrogenase